MLLTRDAILAARDLKREEVDVPEWGGSILVREMSALEQMCFEQTTVGVPITKWPPDTMARVASWCIVDEAGVSLFGVDDIKALGQKSTEALGRVFAVVSRLSGYGASKEEQAEIEEQQAKKSETAQSGASPTN